MHGTMRLIDLGPNMWHILGELEVEGPVALNSRQVHKLENWKKSDIEYAARFIGTTGAKKPGAALGFTESVRDLVMGFGDMSKTKKGRSPMKRQTVNVQFPEEFRSKKWTIQTLPV